jgi:HSP20 family protein
MALALWDPFRALRRRDDVFEDLFRDFFARRAEGEEPELPVEIAESNGDVTVKVQVPGVEKDQLNLSITDDTLTVRGEVRKEEKEEKKNFYRREIRYGAFQRLIALPTEVEAAKATAQLKNGVLTVKLPKAAQPKAQQIKVAVA